MQPELLCRFLVNRAGGDREALLRFPFKAAKRQALCGSLEARLEVGDFELDQSTQYLPRSKPGADSCLAVAAGRAFRCAVDAPVFARLGSWSCDRATASNGISAVTKNTIERIHYVEDQSSRIPHCS